MTTVIVPVNAYAASLSIPADGEGVSAASVALYVQEIANRLEFIRQRTPGANPVANLLTLGRNGGDAVLVAGTANWRAEASNVPAGAVTTLKQLVVSTEPAVITFDKIGPGMVLRNFKAFFRGAGGHAALPVVMPKIELVKFSPAAQVGISGLSVYTIVDTMSDASGSTAAYQFGHIVTKAVAGTPTVGADEQFAIRVTGESGANALIGLECIWAGVDVSA